LAVVVFVMRYRLDSRARPTPDRESATGCAGYE
jgi:hypothetical protein